MSWYQFRCDFTTEVPPEELEQVNTRIREALHTVPGIDYIKNTGIYQSEEGDK